LGFKGLNSDIQFVLTETFWRSAGLTRCIPRTYEIHRYTDCKLIAAWLTLSMKSSSQAAKWNVSNGVCRLWAKPLYAAPHTHTFRLSDRQYN